MKTTITKTKKIAKVVIFYDDGSLQEIESTTAETPVSFLSTSENTLNFNDNFGTFTPAPTLNSPYSWSMGYMDNMSGTADGAPTTNKYTITSTGNGHVELQG